MMDDLDRDVCERAKYLIEKTFQNDSTFKLHRFKLKDPGWDVELETDGYNGKIYITVSIDWWKIENQYPDANNRKFRRSIQKYDK